MLGPPKGSVLSRDPKSLEARLRSLVLSTALLTTPAAASATCDALVGKVADTSTEALPGLYAEVIACDKAQAAEAFTTFMRASDQVPALVDLSLRAIEGEVYEPVWAMMEQITDYGTREDIARRVGAMCQDNVGVLPFLRGGYYAMNDRAFSMWGEAFVTCSSEELTTWLKTEIASPPARTYDDKYNSLLTATVKRLGPDALTPLERAAVASSERGGPFTSVLEKMQEAVRPAEMGKEVSAEANQRLAASLVRVGNGGVRPEQAALVADRLHQSGHPTEAAGLLKVVYGDRVQSDGSLLYGVTSVEHCGGEAVVHVAAVREPSKRWSIVDDITPIARGFKQRLKCDTDGDWSVVVTPAPMTTQGEIDGWAEEIAKNWTDKKLAVKQRSEKAIVLP